MRRNQAGLYTPSVLERLETLLVARMRTFMYDDFPDYVREKERAERAALLLDDDGTSVGLRPTPLLFAPGEPSCFYEDEAGTPYRGQESAKRRLDVHIRGMKEAGRFKCLLTGPAGSGKTALARIIARRLCEEYEARGVSAGLYYELLPSQLRDKASMDALFALLSERDTVFIDEVHALERVEDLFHVLHDTGAARYPRGDGQVVDVPEGVSWIAATTDPGALLKLNGGALHRRLEPEIVLEPPKLSDLAAILQDQRFPIHPDAAFEAAERSGGMPWQVKLIYEEAQRYARVEGCEEISPTHMEEAFLGMGLDKNGLLPQDRNVLRALFSVETRLVTTGEVLHKMGEVQLCEMAGVDRETYKKRIQPKLFRLGVLTLRGGQCLTEKGTRLCHEMMLSS